jgi:hypothetical protein
VRFGVFEVFAGGEGERVVDREGARAFCFSLDFEGVASGSFSGSLAFTLALGVGCFAGRAKISSSSDNDEAR